MEDRGRRRSRRGIIGASTAFHFARLGVKNVVLCERNVVAAGASGRSVAFIQMHMRTMAEARLCAASVPYWLHWDEIVGGLDDVFIRTGYLRTEASRQADNLRANVTMLREAGINTSLLTAAQAGDVAPHVRMDDVAVAAYEPDDGYANAANATVGLTQRAMQLGAEVIMGTEITKVLLAKGCVTGVATTAGHIATPVVVLAAGAWSAPLLGSLRIKLPIERARVQVTIFSWSIGLGPTVPISIMDGVRQVYYRPGGPMAGTVLAGLGVGGRRPLCDPDGCPDRVDQDFAKRCFALSIHSVPAAADVHLIGGRGGPVNITPDRTPVIDRWLAARGLYFVLDSGRNFKTAPAIGRAIAEWEVEGAPRVVDLRPFRAARFVEDDLLIGAHEYEDPTGDYKQIQDEKTGARRAVTSREAKGRGSNVSA